MLLHDHIKKARQKRQIVQTEAAEYFGVRQPTYAKWESGTRMPSREHLPKLFLFLGEPDALNFLELIAESAIEE